MQDASLNIKYNLIACFAAATISAGIYWYTIKNENKIEKAKEQPTKNSLESAPENDGGFM